MVDARRKQQGPAMYPSRYQMTSRAAAGRVAVDVEDADERCMSLLSLSARPRIGEMWLGMQSRDDPILLGSSRLKTLTFLSNACPPCLAIFYSRSVISSPKVPAPSPIIG